ncbi:MAG: hypothetical protein HON47_04415 [Candidatus Diapherotrites archaeon]|jgi:hypothetical protein|uniref:Uncharacterized protein n=1 Tax=Candidatus Iainarchaeum sp. TaxID=3101447 RepID=A0A8T5GFK5_9ARCH|nr:hypothetical protein [Candidatus Diapherotrites archaeon]MBT7240889.1 hypothetical protein [Candidatus Diapherotrites archaeon]
MNEKHLSIICLIVILMGGILFFISYQNEFETKTISSITNEEKGIIFGKIEYVIKNSPSTIFVINDGNKILAYYPKSTNLAKNDFVTIYAKKQLYNEKEELYVYKVITQ